MMAEEDENDIEETRLENIKCENPETVNCERISVIKKSLSSPTLSNSSAESPDYSDTAICYHQNSHSYRDTCSSYPQDPLYRTINPTSSSFLMENILKDP